ncbi:hypothetical protein BDZ85DRAFT_85701 [Elsinoe ampelina]|uniref:Uncharacterized protein n=1 Tax=Elsinoe ampelina TaxID=302913 RepID=A0A6A6GGR4_9PEZI|nr:hypothetical protein BDZ85DRAFT_85701 [Elsinoe ampelina]
MAHSLSDMIARMEDENGRFWYEYEGTFIEDIRAVYEQEIRRLQRAPPASERIKSDTRDATLTKSPSKILLNGEFDEVNRTMVSLLAAKWLWTEDYVSFTRNQKEAVKLPMKAFLALAQWFRATLKDPQDQLLFVTLLVVHDLGKDPELVKELKELKAESEVHSSDNHDLLVLKAVESDLIDVVKKLNAEVQEGLVTCLRTGPTLSIGQLVQGENVPASLAPVLELQGKASRYFDLKYFEQVLDVAGASGHVDHTGAVTYTLPVHISFNAAYKSLRGIADGRFTLRQGYDLILKDRGDQLHGKGFQSLDVGKDRDRAILRLLCMGRVTEPDTAELFLKAFRSLTPLTRKQLTDGLSVDGIDDGEAIIPYYMPTLFLAALKVEQGLPEERLKKYDPGEKVTIALASLMRFLAQAFDGAFPRPGQKGGVKEKDMLFAKVIIDGEAFKSDPGILDLLGFPEVSLV